jgi:hypothetical protein
VTLPIEDVEETVAADEVIPNQILKKLANLSLQASRIERMAKLNEALSTKKDRGPSVSYEFGW